MKTATLLLTFFCLWIAVACGNKGLEKKDQQQHKNEIINACKNCTSSGYTITILPVTPDSAQRIFVPTDLNISMNHIPSSLCLPHKLQSVNICIRTVSKVLQLHRYLEQIQLLLEFWKIQNF